MGETSTKPYLIRALHEWCTDNGYTPYITVQVDEHTMVPMAHVRDGQITLNVGTLAAIAWCWAANSSNSRPASAA